MNVHYKLEIVLNQLASIVCVGSTVNEETFSVR